MRRRCKPQFQFFLNCHADVNYTTKCHITITVGAQQGLQILPYK
jgi:hypothetical protein